MHTRSCNCTSAHRCSGEPTERYRPRLAPAQYTATRRLRGVDDLITNRRNRGPPRTVGMSRGGVRGREREREREREKESGSARGAARSASADPGCCIHTGTRAWTRGADHRRRRFPVTHYLDHWDDELEHPPTHPHTHTPRPPAAAHARAHTIPRAPCSGKPRARAPCLAAHTSLVARGHARATPPARNLGRLCTFSPHHPRCPPRVAADTLCHGGWGLTTRVWVCLRCSVPVPLPVPVLC